MTDNLLLETTTRGIYIITHKNASTPLILSEDKFIEIFQITDKAGFLAEMARIWEIEKESRVITQAVGKDIIMRYTRDIGSVLAYKLVGGAKVEL